MLKQKQFLVLFLGLFLVISGCIPTSKYPLREYQKDSLDTSLIGIWEAHQEDEHVVLHIGLDGEQKYLKFYFVESNENGQVSLRIYQGFNTVEGDTAYLNLQAMEKGVFLEDFIFLRYKIDNKTLKIDVMGQADVLKQAIVDGTIKGEIEKEEWGETIVISENSSEKLCTFLNKEQEQLFDEFVVLSRLSFVSPQE